MKISSDGSALLYSTYLGGSGDDISAGVAVDSSDKVFLTGQTNSTDFPVTASAIQGVYQGGDYDAFVSQINPLLSGAVSLRFSSYFGGSGDDRAMDVTVENLFGGSNFYITGATNSTNLPTFPTNPIQPSYGGGVSDDFVISLFSSNTDVPLPINVVYAT